MVLSCLGAEGCLVPRWREVRAKSGSSDSICRQSPLKALLRRTAYPHARSLRDESGLDDVIRSLIQSFLGEPPPVQVAIFEVEPFTFTHSVKLRGAEGRACLLIGHTDTVLAVAMKGNLIVTGSYDNTARIWDATRAVCLKTILHDCPVTAVGVERSTVIIGGGNGATVVGSIMGEGTVVSFVSDVKNEAVQLFKDLVGLPSRCSCKDCIHFAGHAAAVLAVLLQGDIVATASADCTARIWEASTGKLRHILQGHQRRVNSVALHNNLQLLVTGSADATARLWNAASGELLQVLPATDAQVEGTSLSWLRASLCRADPVVAVAIAGDFVATGFAGGRVQVWNRRSSQTRVLSEAEEHGKLGALALQADGTAAVCFKAGFAKIWNLANEAPPFLVTTGCCSHVSNPSYALLL
eukprot:TRINITY_DN62052_c0_g1_i1.p1 TRINITY_DN62052_c0_g1~~TRINITY_DN62052_c0_g1_i1.p1  ORF type:complete len:411 (-),score=69.33 TRINITY_DN62052_c0_g1_i1:70-1302(-)